MAKFTLAVKADNKGLDRFYEVNNIYTVHDENGNLEVHAFAGPDAQARYEAFVRSVKGILASEEINHETGKRKEGPAGTQS